MEVEQHDRAALREQCDQMEKKAGLLFAERQEVQAAIDQVPNLTYVGIGPSFQDPNIIYRWKERGNRLKAALMKPGSS